MAPLSYRDGGLQADFLGHLRAAADVDGHHRVQELLLDLHVIQEARDTPGLHKKLQLMPVCVEESLCRETWVVFGVVTAAVFGKDCKVCKDFLFSFHGIWLCSD